MKQSIFTGPWENVIGVWELHEVICFDMHWFHGRASDVNLMILGRKFAICDKSDKFQPQLTPKSRTQYSFPFCLSLLLLTRLQSICATWLFNTFIVCSAFFLSFMNADWIPSETFFKFPNSSVHRSIWAWYLFNFSSWFTIRRSRKPSELHNAKNATFTSIKHKTKYWSDLPE